MRATAVKHVSRLDRSVNWVTAKGRGSVETRYVRRWDPIIDRASNHFIAYVSSHSGCKMGCNMCYLTHQKQNTFEPVTVPEFTQQVKTVVDHYTANTNNESRAQRMNVNFMARGEAFANPNVVNKFPEIYSSFAQLAESADVRLKINISTIFPWTMSERTLDDVFKGKPAHVYYSLYSLRHEVRAKWLPNAMPWQIALDRLKLYSDSNPHIDTPITIHHSYIEGVNDDLADAEDMAGVLRSFNLRAKFNLVRFNPPPGSNYKEPSEQRLHQLFGIVAGALNHPQSYIVPRVGPDVFASCGMFVK